MHMRRNKPVNTD